MSYSCISEELPREPNRLRITFPPCSFLNGACLKCGAVMLSPHFFTSYKHIALLPSTPRILPISASAIAVANAPSDVGSTTSFTRCFTICIAMDLYLSTLSSVVSKSCRVRQHHGHGCMNETIKTIKPNMMIAKPILNASGQDVLRYIVKLFDCACSCWSRALQCHR